MLLFPPTTRPGIRSVSSGGFLPVKSSVYAGRSPGPLTVGTLWSTCSSTVTPRKWRGNSRRKHSRRRRPRGSNHRITWVPRFGTPPLPPKLEASIQVWSLRMAVGISGFIPRGPVLNFFFFYLAGALDWSTDPAPGAPTDWSADPGTGNWAGDQPTTSWAADQGGDNWGGGGDAQASAW